MSGVLIRFLCRSVRSLLTNVFVRFIITYVIYNKRYSWSKEMPAIRKTSKEAIINAAVDVLRESGAAALNARNVAKKLGCSTQPIYLCFQNMEDLKAAMTRQVIALHTQSVREWLHILDADDSCYRQHSHYSSYGIGFVKFAALEKHLFRWLYLEGGQPGPHQDDVLLPEIIAAIVNEYGYSEELAEKLHRDMTYYSYGLAILANTGHLNLTDAELLASFRREFTALAAYYGVSPIPLRFREQSERTDVS